MTRRSGSSLKRAPGTTSTPFQEHIHTPIGKSSSFILPSPLRPPVRECLGPLVTTSQANFNNDKTHPGWHAGELRGTGRFPGGGRPGSASPVPRGVHLSGFLPRWRPGHRETRAPQPKDGRKWWGRPKQPFYRLRIQMRPTRGLVLIGREGTLRPTLIGPFSSWVPTNQSAKVGWPPTKSSSTCKLCFCLEYFAWVCCVFFPIWAFTLWSLWSLISSYTV
jgi:hypothetical protein